MIAWDAALPVFHPDAMDCTVLYNRDLPEWSLNVDPVEREEIRTFFNDGLVQQQCFHLMLPRTLKQHVGGRIERRLPRARASPSLAFFPASLGSGFGWPRVRLAACDRSQRGLPAPDHRPQPHMIRLCFCCTLRSAAGSCLHRCRVYRDEDLLCMQCTATFSSDLDLEPMNVHGQVSRLPSVRRPTEVGFCVKWRCLGVDSSIQFQTALGKGKRHVACAWVAEVACEMPCRTSSPIKII